MITLESFYDLISRNAQVTLLNTRCRTNIFSGSGSGHPRRIQRLPGRGLQLERQRPPDLQDQGQGNPASGQQLARKARSESMTGSTTTG